MSDKNSGNGSAPTAGHQRCGAAARGREEAASRSGCAGLRAIFSFSAEELQWERLSAAGRGQRAGRLCHVCRILTASSSRAVRRKTTVPASRASRCLHGKCHRCYWCYGCLAGRCSTRLSLLGPGLSHLFDSGPGEGSGAGKGVGAASPQTPFNDTRPAEHPSPPPRAADRRSPSHSPLGQGHAWAFPPCCNFLGFWFGFFWFSGFFFFW